jgi:hypothetical protein
MFQPVLAALAAAALATGAEGAPPPASEPASAPPPAAASTSYLGVGLGVTLPTGGGESGSALRIRVGVPRSRRLLLGLEGGVAGVGSSRLSFLDVGATYYPFEQWLFLRCAAGLSFRSDQVAAGPTGQATSRVEQGPNLLVGLGSALSRRPGFDLTFNLEYQRHLTGADGASLGDHGTDQVTAWVGLEWL